jgi:hypothetical protein
MILQGFLIDEDEFEIKPAITRTFQMYETESKIKKRKPKKPEPQIPATYAPMFPIGNLVNVMKFNYTVNLRLSENKNIFSFQVFINDDFYGSDITEIQINPGDELRLVITKNDNTKESDIIFVQELI